MRKETTIDICRVHLFHSVDKMQESNVSPQMIERVRRIRSVYTIWNDYPLKKEKEMVDMLLGQYKISRSEVYEDLKVIKQLLGDFNAASKGWHLFKFNSMILKAYERAEIKDNSMGMIMAAKEYAKYNQLDKENQVTYPWEEIILQPFEITSDPTVIGIKPVPNIKERIAELKNKYGKDIDEVDFIEIGVDPELLSEAKNYGK